MPVTLVRLELEGYSGSLVFHPGGVTVVLLPDAATLHRVRRALTLCLGPEPRAASDAMVARVSMTAGGAGVDVQVATAGPMWRLSAAGGSCQELGDWVEARRLLESWLRVPGLTTPFLPALRMAPFQLPSELAFRPRTRDDGPHRPPTALEDYARAWGEHVCWKQALELVLSEQARTEKLTARQDDLRSRLRDGFQVLGSLPEPVLADLPRLISIYQELSEVAARYDTRQSALSQALRTARGLAAQLEPHQARYGSLDPDFPLHLQRWKVLQETLKTEEAESSALSRQLQDNGRISYQYRRFDSIPEDFQARMGAIVVLEDEDHVRLHQLQETLDQVRSLQQAVDEGGKDLDPELRDVPVEQALELRELVALRRRLASIQGQAAPVEERLRAEVERRPPGWDLVRNWPDEFAPRLRQWRLHQRTVRRVRAARDAADAEMAQARRLADGLRRHLAAFEGLHEQPEGFGDRLEDLLRTRQELEVEMEARRGLDDRIAAVRAVVAEGIPRYGDSGELYLQWVDALRGRLWGWRQKVAHLQRTRRERAELEAQLRTAEDSLQIEYADLRTVPMDFPARLREYHRLRQVADDLQRQQDALAASQTRLEATLTERYGALAQVTAETRAKVEASRSRDETLHRMLVRLERDVQARRDAEERLAILEDTLRGLDYVEHLPAGALRILAETASDREPVASSAFPALEEAERQDRRHRDEVRQALEQELGAEAGQLGMRYAEWRRGREEKARVEASMTLLPPIAETEALRTAILALVAGRLEETGLSIGAIEYLEYQTIQAELVRIEESRNRLLQRSGAGNDLVRIGEKLAELVSLLGPRVTVLPLTEALARYEAASAVRDTIHRVSSALESLPTSAGLEADCTAVEQDIQREMRRLHVTSEADLKEAAAGCQQFQAAQSSLKALEELRERRESEAGDGRNVEWLEAQVRFLERKLGRWAVASLDQVAGQTARWRTARYLGGELEAVEQRLRKLESEPPGAEPEPLDWTLDVPESAADDDLLVTMVQQVREAQGREDRLLQELHELLGTLASADEPATGLVERMKSRIEALETALGPLALAEDGEALADRLEVDGQKRAELDATRERVKALASPTDVERTMAEVRERQVQRRVAVGVDPAEDVELVLRDYRTWLEMHEERRTLLRLLAARDAAILDLRTRMEELRPLLGGRQRETDLARELETYQSYRSLQTRSHEMEERMAELREEIAALAARRTPLEAQLRSVQEQVGHRSVEEILRDYPAFVEVQADLEDVRLQLEALPSPASCRQRLASLEAEAHLVIAPPPDFSHRLDAERARREDGGATLGPRALERASALVAELSAGQLVRAGVDDQGQPCLWRSNGASAPVDEPRPWMDAIWHLALAAEMDPEYPWPVLLEEPFLKMNEQALGRMQALLERCGRQVVILTQDPGLVFSQPVARWR